jgi:hypothetical protein
MPKSLNDRVKARRDALRSAGPRPIQIWAPDSRVPEFAAECRRQSNLVAAAERDNTDLVRSLDAALDDIAGSGEWR